MYTSLVLLAMMGPGATPTASEALKWQESYGAAMQEGKRLGKPVAVFIGRGKKGWRQVCRDGTLSVAAEKRLAGRYVCVYVDADTTTGAELARAFRMTRGLVLSTKDGGDQAFRHAGTLATKEMERTLAKYASGMSVAQTETLERERVSFSYSPGSNTTGQPVVAPTFVPNYAGFGGFGGFGGGGRGC